MNFTIGQQVEIKQEYGLPYDNRYLITAFDGHNAYLLHITDENSITQILVHVSMLQAV